MPASPRQPNVLGRWLLRIGAAAAIVAQLAVSAAPLAEALQGQDAAAHVELAGTATHYAHNDATCASCQARSLHGLASAGPAALVPARGHDAGDASVAAEVVAEPFSSNHPRAPPRSSSI